MAANAIRRVISARVCGLLPCARCLPAVVLGDRMAACVGCSLAAVISQAAAAGQVFRYLGVNDGRTVFVSSLITLNLTF